MIFNSARSFKTARAVDVLAGALPPAKVAGNARLWSGNYRLTVPGLPTNRVSLIEPFAFRRKVAPDSVGSAREATRSTSTWEIPNLVFYMLPTDSQAWLAWHKDFVIKGNASDVQEKSFTLEFLSPDMNDTLLTL